MPGEGVVAVIKSEALNALTAAAIALPGLLQQAKAAEPPLKFETDFQYGHYSESNDRIDVDIYQGMAVIPVSQSLALKANWVVDTFSGATPVLTMPAEVAQTITGASGISAVDGSKTVTESATAIEVMTGASTRETRYGVDLGLSYYLDNLTVNISGSRSEEPDYLSHAYHIGMEWQFNKKLNSLTLGFGQNFDEIEPNTRRLQAQKSDHHVQLGFSQVLSKKSVLRISTHYTYSEGYLSNPYKKVFIQNLGSGLLDSGGFNNVYYEQRPDKRHQCAVSIGYIHYLSTLDSAFHLDYRYYRDSWDIDSHTFEMVYQQPLAKGWMLTPRLRYYSQSQASFYQLFYSQAGDDHYYSSDFRLAGFGTLSGGIKLAKDWQLKSPVSEAILFETGFEYSAHAAALQLGGQTAADLTDFNYLLFTASINLTF